jgi:Fe-S-cluster containining protein
MTEDDDPWAIARHAEQGAVARALTTRRDALAAGAGSAARVDALLATVRDRIGASLACGVGCSACCHFRVAARPDEVFRVVAAIPAQSLNAVAERARANADALFRMTEHGRMVANLPCALLHEGRCLVYDARPHACRAHHAVDREGCDAALAEPERTDLEDGGIPLLQTLAAGHEDGAASALREAGYDTELVELNAAVSDALRHAGPRERFDEGRVAFPGLGWVR